MTDPPGGFRDGRYRVVRVLAYLFGIDPGPTVIMPENARTGLLWKRTRPCPRLARGLRRAGFTGGWP